MLIDQQALGVIAVQSYDEGYLYSESELNILRFVSQHIAVAIQRKLNTEQQKLHQEELERKIFERTRELRQTNLFLRLQVEERKKVEERLFHEANHPLEFLRLGNWVGARPGRLGTDVEHVRTLLQRLLGATKRGADIAMQPVARERIVGQVDDRHHLRLAEIETETAALKDGHHENPCERADAPVRLGWLGSE